ncbi:MAG: molybdate ABC transporter substrate-binding protein [Cellulomonadaceae bacterium]|jgi:molybdate transport system substrate-binding protein|nr:molybdate ABC transporter substrate-binding protein [Cellulomonadaceae bacterium]
MSTPKPIAILTGAKALALTGVTLLILAACGPRNADGDALGQGSGTSGDNATVDVFVAASFNNVVQEIADDFTAENPGVTIRLSPAGSADLSARILAGAPADILITADEGSMTRFLDDRAEQDPQVEDLIPTPLASNTLALVVPKDNPAGIASIEDLNRSGIRLVICAPRVPCGDAAARLAEELNLAWSPVSEEGSVTDVLGKVTSGEADAGIVYATDVKAALANDSAALTEIAIPHVPESDTRSVVVQLTDNTAAQEFTDWLTGPRGLERLQEAGFGAPE